MARRSPLVRLQGDEKLIAMIREGQAWAFEALFDRYQSRLLAFCRHMLPSEQDAEDVLQDVFVSANKAILKDNRAIKVKPWLYRIARNRCLNHLRRPVPEGSDEMMDEHPFNGGTTTAEQVQSREELREVLVDVKHLPETQRTALLLREVDALSYSEIAEAMDTTVPAVKSLLVRARITLAESSQARLLTCGEVQLELAEAAEGLAKASGPVRQHLKGCEQCKDFRDQLRSSSKALAALLPLGPLALFKDAILAKLGGAGASSAGAGAGGGAGATATGGAAGGAAATSAGAAGAAGGATAASGVAAGTAIGGAAAATGGAGGIGGGISVIGGAIGTKAVAGVATAAVAVAGAVEVKRYVVEEPAAETAAISRADAKPIVAEEAAPAKEPATLPVAPAPEKQPETTLVAAEPTPVPPLPAAPESKPSPAQPAPTANQQPAAPAGSEPDGPEIGSAASHDRPPAAGSGVVTTAPAHQGSVPTAPPPSSSKPSLTPGVPGSPPGGTTGEPSRTPPAPVAPAGQGSTPAPAAAEPAPAEAPADGGGDAPDAA